MAIGDTGGRVVRGGMQVSAGQFIMQGLDAFNLLGQLTPAQYGWVSAAVSLLVMLAQNLIEKKIGKAFLKPMPPAEEVEVVEEDDFPVPEQVDPEPPDGF